jgi:hypothetical protein
MLFKRPDEGEGNKVPLVREVAQPSSELALNRWVKLACIFLFKKNF